MVLLYIPSHDHRAGMLNAPPYSSHQCDRSTSFRSSNASAACNCILCIVCSSIFETDETLQHEHWSASISNALEFEKTCHCLASSIDVTFFRLFLAISKSSLPFFWRIVYVPPKKSLLGGKEVSEIRKSSCLYKSLCV